MRCASSRRARKRRVAIRNFPSQCDRILKAFDCKDQIDGTSLLWADPAIACDDYYKGTVMLWALFFLAVYGFGVPGLFLQRLRHFKGFWHMKQPTKQLGFLYVDSTAWLAGC